MLRQEIMEKVTEIFREVFDEKKRQTENAASILAEHISQLEETRMQILKRLREVSKRYKEAKDGIFMKFVESNGLTEWAGHDWIPNYDGEGGTVSHKIVIKKINECNPLMDSIKLLRGMDNSTSRLTEQTVDSKMQEVKDSFTTAEEAERRRIVEDKIATDILTGGIGE